ncbi:MAG: Crp/Fnr family transcriptional regulator [Planctomycetia bacterium]|nr:Crp/Fnr family transcriptional regulator [Planctomycetia bacterium]
MAGPIWYLKRCDLFERLSDTEAERLNRRALVRKFKRNAVIYAPAEAGESVLVLAHGRVKIYDLTRDGHETILAFIEEGELFGELAALDGQPRQEFAEAVEDCELLAIPREDFVALLEARGDLALSVTRLVGLRRQRVETRLRNILFLPSRDRLVRTLVELVEAHGERTGDQYTIRFPLSHQDFASLIGVTRETVTLTLGQLQAEGLVTIERRRVIVLDLDRLRQNGDGPSDPPAAKSRTKTAPM